MSKAIKKATHKAGAKKTVIAQGDRIAVPVKLSKATLASKIMGRRK